MSDDTLILPEPLIEAPELTAEEKRALFQEIEAMNQEKEDLEAKIREVDVRKQEKLARIAKLCGTGPFNFKGRILALKQGLGRSKDRSKYTLVEQKIKVPEDIG
jgi:SMC interacting uncharacterized protein involved in chromosome segregation